MNLKVANLVAVQFGIFVGTMSWLAYSHFPSAEPRASVEIPERSDVPAATATPTLEPKNQLPYTLDYATDREPPQPVVERSAPPPRQYVRSVATQPYASSAVTNASPADDALSYAEVDEEPALLSPDYVASPQFVAYPSQFVVFSNRRPFPNRCGPPHHGTHMTTTDRHPIGREPHPNRCGIVLPHNPNATSRQPAQDFRPRRKETLGTTARR